jgi:hypothetical protein
MVVFLRTFRRVARKTTIAFVVSVHMEQLVSNWTDDHAGRVEV